MDSNPEDFFITTEIATNIWVTLALETAFRKVLVTALSFPYCRLLWLKKKTPATECRLIKACVASTAWSFETLIHRVGSKSCS